MNDPSPDIPGVCEIEWKFRDGLEHYLTDGVWTGKRWEGFEKERVPKDRIIISFKLLRRNV